MLHLLRVLTLALVLGTPVLASAAPEYRPAEISFAETLKLAEAGQLKSVRLLDDRQARVTTMDGRTAVIRTPVS
ncbi:hypothetical protein AB4156_42965, partial [Cupriavidus sp. 2MCAB6]